MHIAKSIALLVSTALLAPAPAFAQDVANEQQEQAFLPGGLMGIACEGVTGVLGAIFGNKTKDTLRDVGGALGICKKKETAATPTPNATSPAPTPTTVAAIQPGLQVHVLAVTPPAAAGGEAQVAAGTPDTIYRQNEGFALIVANNATGYLEVWSVDDTTTSFIEGIVITSKAGAVALPKKVQGYYRLTTAGGSDRIRFRFFPCRLSQEEAFVAHENAQVAELVTAQKVAVDTLDRKLGSCPFGAKDLDKTKPNQTLFATTTKVAPSYSSATQAFTAVSGNGGPIETEIALKRQ